MAHGRRNFHIYNGEKQLDIVGLQKLTLLDFPGHVACTVFLPGCDLRCPFCYNTELIDGSAPVLMDDEELLKFLCGRIGILDGVAFTGGEPLLSGGLPEVMKKIRELGYMIKLDTNGFHPDRLRQVIDDGLVDYVAMDIKNSPARYAATSGRESLDLAPVEESIRILMETGNGGSGAQGAAEGFGYEFRTTTVAELHDEESFREIGKWIAGAKRYYLQSFTDTENVPFAGLSAPDEVEMKRYLEIVREFVPAAELRGI
jgi:pyruvate formate lyase activating enzyme